MKALPADPHDLNTTPAWTRKCQALIPCSGRKVSLRQPDSKKKAWVAERKSSGMGGQEICAVWGGAILRMPLAGQTEVSLM
jgi:hypothetical protein